MNFEFRASYNIAILQWWRNVEFPLVSHVIVVEIDFFVVSKMQIIITISTLKTITRKCTSNPSPSKKQQYD